MGKLLLILLLTGALANGVARSRAQPPLLIDSPQSPLDAAR
jgi:hypothetical protein